MRFFKVLAIVCLNISTLVMEMRGHEQVQQADLNNMFILNMIAAHVNQINNNQNIIFQATKSSHRDQKNMTTDQKKLEIKKIHNKDKFGRPKKNVRQYNNAQHPRGKN